MTETEAALRGERITHRTRIRQLEGALKLAADNLDDCAVLLKLGGQSCYKSVEGVSAKCWDVLNEKGEAE